MTPSLMRYSTANLSRQKKESFNLQTGLLKLASLRIRKKKPWRKRTEPQTAVGQHGLYRYMQDGSPQEGRKGQRGYLKNWSETSKTDKERESIHLRGSTNPTRTNWKRVTLRQCTSSCQRSEKQPEVTCHTRELLSGTNGCFLLGKHRGQQTVGWCI